MAKLYPLGPIWLVGFVLMRWFKLSLGAAALLFGSTAVQAKWHEASSRHFTIYADQDPAELKAFAETLERFNSAVREARGIADVEPGASSRVTLYVLRDVGAIQKLYGDDNVAGFYMPKASGSVAFVPDKGSRGKWGLSADGIFFHEYMHHLMHGDTDRPWPSWVSEGSAEFYATPKFTANGGVEFGAPPLYRADVLSPVGTLSLAKMLSGDFTYLTYREYESIYGRGWMLIHYLAFEPQRRGQLTRYLNGIAAGVPALKAAEDAFGDLRKLERELYSYYKRNTFKLTTIPADRLSIPPISTRALSAGESELIDARIKLARGGKRVGAAALADRATAVAARYPGDARVQTLTAQLKNSADDHQAALSAADKAVALDARSYPALIERAHAMMALAKSDKKGADWNKVRAAFLAANKVDPEGAEPLIGYYRSFVAQGISPTSNAAEGLAYALVLAPQDDQLRMEIVGHMIDSNRLESASRALMPLAFDPHKGKRRNAAIAIFEALKAGNRTLAREKWGEAQQHYRAE